MTVSCAKVEDNIKYIFLKKQPDNNFVLAKSHVFKIKNQLNLEAEHLSTKYRWDLKL